MGETRRLQIAPCPEREVALLTRELGVSAVLAQVLARRGLGDPARARAFIEANEEHPASAFAGIELAVQAILEHVRRGERITVHGDYDVDGICSTAVLVRALRALGADVDWYLPDRASDGYGLNALTVERLAARGTRLLLTADCAITAVQEVAAAKALGMEVVVTDHHAPRADGVLPDAPIVHPAVCGYPCAELCATAVAHKLAQALVETAHSAYRPHDDLDLVALATIADVVPLLGENRALVRRGLRALGATAKPGLRALMSVARVDPSRVGERAVAFGLAPRLNAAGRLYRADAGLELILTEDPVRAAQIADELDRANRERRHTETRILFEAEAQLATQGEQPAYVLAGEGWHPGVIGIVASRLAERHHRPVVMIALEGDTGKGSARSIECFDLLGALHACAARLDRYGGHRAAAGMELARAELESFREAFVAYAAANLDAEQLVRGERVDALLDVGEIGMELAEELQTLAPFGAGNPTVALLVRGATLAERRPMGEGRHLRFTVQAHGARARAVAFGNNGRLSVQEGEAADAIFTLEVNEWNGVSEPRLVLRHAQAAAGEGAPSPALAGGEAPAQPADPGQLVFDLAAAAPAASQRLEGPLPCDHGESQGPQEHVGPTGRRAGAAQGG
jgi:single-stranded-DNA-specific exonuclease